ncbi:conserved hypothetical protein [Ricinus communis]|uniref:Uncharacterized protein n=1 Tax=Ricinus communis TaxID=3988 RepID=B9T5P0_RICCO|nr:conserved hypothetical protein [Ricinus communis]
MSWPRRNAESAVLMSISGFYRWRTDMPLTDYLDSKVKTRLDGYKNLILSREKVVLGFAYTSCVDLKIMADVPFH